jgi:cytochrome c peroxidase
MDETQVEGAATGPTSDMIKLSRLLIVGSVGLVAFGLAGARAGDDTGLTRPQAYARAAALEALGRKLFFDPALSASGQMACAGCHDPAHGFSPANDRAVQLGGKDLRQPGQRAVPSLTYLQTVPPFTEHYHDSDDEGDDSIDNGPTGGLTWDGRMDRGRDQAAFPLTSPFEMANADAATAVARARKAGYGAALAAIFGADVFDDDRKGFAALTEALEVFEQSARDFYPYSSKYDAWLAGRAQLSPQEARGLKLFEDPQKGNCASCHISRRANDGTPPQFTDYGFIALGLPRNKAIPANADPAWHDLGLCGPLRTDFTGKADYCGLFRTPSLRNVALRKTFFHNGLVHTLREAVAFYVERDTQPEKWYPRAADGRLAKFDDLPAQYVTNVNTDPPFGGKPGDTPALSPAEIDDIVTFLTTLTDGYRPAR